MTNRKELLWKAPKYELPKLVPGFWMKTYININMNTILRLPKLPLYQLEMFLLKCFLQKFLFSISYFVHLEI